MFYTTVLKMTLYILGCVWPVIKEMYHIIYYVIQSVRKRKKILFQTQSVIKQEVMK